MGLLKANYNYIRAKVGTGDVIAFSGSGYISKIRFPGMSTNVSDHNISNISI